MLFVLLPTCACRAAREQGASTVEISTAALRSADTERLLLGRFDFRVVEGWMVRFDTAKGTYCSLENLSDGGFAASVLKHGQQGAEASVPGGETCKD